MLFKEGHQFFDPKVGEFEISHGHGGGRGLPKDLVHPSEGLAVGGDVDPFVFVAIFFQVGFDINAPGAAGFYVDGHHGFESSAISPNCPVD